MELLSDNDDEEFEEYSSSLVKYKQEEMKGLRNTGMNASSRANTRKKHAKPDSKEKKPTIIEKMIKANDEKFTTKRMFEKA